MQAATARRIDGIERTYRVSRNARELLNAKLASSCTNRLKLLQRDPSTALPPFCASTSDPVKPDSATHAMSMLANQTARFHAETEQWEAERKAEAWSHHSRLVNSTLGKDKWWQTSVAGCEVDIRRVHARSPWEHERQVWSWPKTRDSPSSRSGEHNFPSQACLHSNEIDAFVFSLKSSANAKSSNQDAEVDDVQPMRDDAASEWWRAHCLQPHLPPSSGVESSSSEDQHESNNDDGRSRWSAEALANPVFHRLFVDSQRQALKKEAELATRVAVERFEKHVNQRVCEVEMQIEVNTKLQQDIALRRLQIKKRRTREESAVVTIQRVYRGARGRKRAQEFRAEFFVMVRGRAIRKGKCEECGEQQAVLACHECEESLHFCPVCWVQVHSTRRRKQHRAIPMVVEQVAPQSSRNKAKPSVSPQEMSSLHPSTGVHRKSSNLSGEMHAPSKKPSASAAEARQKAPAARSTRAKHERRHVEATASTPTNTVDVVSEPKDSLRVTDVSTSTPEEIDRAPITVQLPSVAAPRLESKSRAVDTATATSSHSIDTNEIVSEPTVTTRADASVAPTPGESSEIPQTELECSVGDGDASCPPPSEQEEIASVETGSPDPEETRIPSVEARLPSGQEEIAASAKNGPSPSLLEEATESEETPASALTAVE